MRPILTKIWRRLKHYAGLRVGTFQGIDVCSVHLYWWHISCSSASPSARQVLLCCCLSPNHRQGWKNAEGHQICQRKAFLLTWAICSAEVSSSRWNPAPLLARPWDRQCDAKFYTLWPNSRSCQAHTLIQLDHLELNDNSRWYPDCPIAIIGKLLDLGKMVNLMMKKLELISDKLS